MRLKPRMMSPDGERGNALKMSKSSDHFLCLREDPESGARALTAPVSDTRCPVRRRSTLHRLLRTGFLCVHVVLVTNSNDRSLVVVWRVTSFETFKARFPKERHSIFEVPSLFRGKQARFSRAPSEPTLRRREWHGSAKR